MFVSVTWRLLLILLAVGLSIVVGLRARAALAQAATEALVERVLEVPPVWRSGPLAEERRLRLPPGFRVGVFAAGLEGARFMALGPGGEVYVGSASGGRAGRVSRLLDQDGDGVAEAAQAFVEGLRLSHSVAYRGGWLYVGETHQVVRVQDADGDGVAERREVVVPDLPEGGSHFTRTIAFGPDGMLYVSIGSTCNVCLEQDPRRATVMRFRPDGSGGEIFAAGLRNSVGLAFHPRTGELWATDNGRDRLGDDFPPDELNVVRQGQHYGWPRCNADRQPDPDFGDPAFCATTASPALGFQAHSAALGLAFAGSMRLPAAFEDSLFVAFHGSWDRGVPTGYRIVRVTQQNDLPVRYDDFVIGWGDTSPAWGRPVDVLVAADGSLLISDDRVGAIYRVSYEGP